MTASRTTMDPHHADALTAAFEANRRRLRSIARRILGSEADADDAVQETWLRLHRTDADGIANLGGWLTTVVSRVCLDRLRERRARGSTGGHVDHAVDHAVAAATDPADDAAMADSLGSALLVVLDQLGPAERVAFVLHDVFAVPFDEIAVVLDRTPESARQLASRARRRLHGASTADDPADPVRHRAVVEAFLRAARSGDFEGLLRVLHPDVLLEPDEAALRMGALRRTTGARHVAALLSGGAQAARLAVIDGLAGFVWAPGGHVRGVVRFTISDGVIRRFDVIGEPDRIAALDVELVDA